MTKLLGLLVCLLWLVSCDGNEAPAGGTGGAGGAPASAGGTNSSGGGSTAGGSSSGGQSGATGGSASGGTANAGGQAGQAGQGGRGGQAGAAGRSIDPVTGCRHEVIPCTYGASDVLVRDFDADGHPDLVFVDTSTLYSSYWVIAWGSASDFSRRASTVTPIYGDVRPILGDFTSDGIEDLVLSGHGAVGASGSAQVLVGDGHGGFTALPTIQRTSAYLMADYNLDGKLDLIRAYAEWNVELTLGNGDGTFALPSTVYAPSSTIYYAGGYVSLADFNEDGKADLVAPFCMTGVASSCENYLLTGNGDGTFTRIGILGVEPAESVVRDLNHDGHQDLAVTNQRWNEVDVWLGDGKGAFEVVTGLVPTVGEGPFRIAAGDVDGDGNVDLSLGNANSSDVSVLLGNGDGTFQAERRIVINPLLFPRYVGIEDVDRDGYGDVLVSTTKDVRIYFGPCLPTT